MTTTTPLTRVLLFILSNLKESAIDLKEMVAAVSTGYGSAYGRGGQAYVAELKRLRNKTILSNSLYQLKRRNYITAKKIGDHLIISLTQKGRAANLINQLKSAKPNSADTYTVVIFDIPESQRLARRQFRLLLRQGNFKKLQQSVWVSKADTYKLMADFIAEAKLKSWVNLYRGTDFLFRPSN